MVAQLNTRRSINDLERDKFNLAGDVRIAPGTSAGDSFNRLRTSEAFGVLDSKQIGTDDPGAWEQALVGGGSSRVYQPLRSSSLLTAGPAANDEAIRQTRWYLPYVPGRSHLIFATGVMGSEQPGFRKRIGYFDGDDGCFFEWDENGEVSVVLRSSTSGGPLETRVHQSDPALSTDGVSTWNVDKMDGHGCSRVNLDMSKSLIFVMDFAWLGVGTARFGFEINGAIHYVHLMHHSNVEDVVYMRTPSLPVRYEITNVTGTASPGTLEQICCTVISEGGYENAGFEYGVSNGIAKRTISARTPILAIRMGSQLNGIDVRRLGQLLENSVYTAGNDVYWELRHIHDPSSFVGTFNAVDPGAGTEFSTDITSIIGARDHLIRPGFSTAGSGPRGSQPGSSIAFKTRHTIYNRNMDNTNGHYLVVFATPMTGNADVSAQLTFVEFA